MGARKAAKVFQRGTPSLGMARGGGASVTLRRLIDESRKAGEGRISMRTARENAYRFMSEMAGDFAGFEEASRALFAGDKPKFEGLVAPWPEDVRLQLAKLAAGGWSAA